MSRRIEIRNRINLRIVVGGGMLALLMALALFGRAISQFSPTATNTSAQLQGPSGLHWLGTDQLGRDVFSRLIAGTGVTLAVGISAAAISVVVGILIGGCAGFFGGWVDQILSRLTEIFVVIPSFFLAVVLVAFVGQSLLNIVLTIGLLSWPIVARITRVEFATLKTRGFVNAARLSGAGLIEILWSEILPNAAGPIVVAATLQGGAAMLLEAGLSYLGLGDPNNASLGLQLQQAQGYLQLAWWPSIVPGVALFLAVFSTNLLGDGVAKVLDVRTATTFTGRTVTTVTGG